LAAGRGQAPGPLDHVYGFGASTRWCVLRKTADESRNWQHFRKF
jgi:hypothetical protein